MIPLDDSMEVPEAPLLSKIYEALGHEVRRDIIRLIGSFGKISYSDLMHYLQIKPGSFFYHLKKMPGLIEQDSEKQYKLTSDGEFSYSVLRQSEDQIINTEKIDDTEKETAIESTKVHTNKQFILFGNLFRNMIANNTTRVNIALIIILQLIILIIGEIGLITPFFFDASYYYNPLILIIEFFIIIFVEWFFLEFISIIFTSWRKVNPSIDILVALPLCNLPLYIYPLIIIVSKLILGIEIPLYILLMILLLLQVWTAFLLAQVLQIQKSLSVELSMLTIIILMYLSSIITYLTTIQ